MTDYERLEAEIRNAIATEKSAAILSEKLFGPTGLFTTMAPTETERQTLVRSELFRTAQARFRELQISEAAAFARAVDESEITFPSSGHRLKLEHAELN